MDQPNSLEIDPEKSEATDGSQALRIDWSALSKFYGKFRHYPEYFLNPRKKIPGASQDL